MTKIPLQGVVLHDEPNWHKIDKVWAFLSVDEQGNEGLCGAPVGDMNMALITGSEDLLPVLKEIAADMAHLYPNKRIKLVRFHTREDLEFIEPSEAT